MSASTVTELAKAILAQKGWDMPPGMMAITLYPTRDARWAFHSVCDIFHNLRFYGNALEAVAQFFPRVDDLLYKFVDVAGKTGVEVAIQTKNRGEPLRIVPAENDKDGLIKFLAHAWPSFWSIIPFDVKPNEWRHLSRCASPSQLPKSCTAVLVAPPGGRHSDGSEVRCFPTTKGRAFLFWERWRKHGPDQRYPTSFTVAEVYRRLGVPEETEGNK